MKRIYLAGPLFSEAERNWHQNTKQQLQTLAAQQGSVLEVVWPYELITQEEMDALGEHARPEIFQRCKQSLDGADILIALLDGTQVDDGTAWEIGYFFANRSASQPIIGVRTDFRSAGESSTAVVNAMIEMACCRIVRSTSELLTEITSRLPVPQHPQAVTAD